MIPGYATPEGTARFAARFPAYRGFYRAAAGGLHVSSLGLGTYLGELDRATDDSYKEAVKAALRGGINFIDSAINYRHQRSELAIGAALREMVNLSAVQRDEVLICTKAGFLTPDAVPEWLRPDDVAGRMHSMAPDFLADQVERSRGNLGLETIDVFYLHNPETQLKFVSREAFEARILSAFAQLEKLSRQGRIRFYGTATWDGYRKTGLLQLPRMLELARDAGGNDHHFRFIQLPFNLAMVEALAGQPESVLQTATREQVTVVASATLLQGRLAAGLPDAVGELLPGHVTDAQRAIQFTRSAPGITVALVGMSDPAHVRDNLGIATTPPATPEQFLRLLA